MAGLSSLVDKAKDMFHKRGGMDAAKGDAQELKDIHSSEGSLSDKAKAAGEALKEPGAAGADRPAGAKRTPEADRPPEPGQTPGPDRP